MFETSPRSSRRRGIERLLRINAKKALQRAVGLCRKAAVKFETRAELGPIAETIVRIAHQIKADQIVMGTRGLGTLRGLFLGSVATKVVQLARMPVPLVK